MKYFGVAIILINLIDKRFISKRIKILIQEYDEI